MLLLFSDKEAVLTTYLGKSCSFGLLCMSFMGVCQSLCVSFFPFGIEGRMWDVIVLITDHCLPIYFCNIFTFVFEAVENKKLETGCKFSSKRWC